MKDHASIITISIIEPLHTNQMGEKASLRVRALRISVSLLSTSQIDVENSARLESARHLTGQIDGAARQKGAD